MKSHKSQKHCKNIREYRLTFEPDQDNVENYIWRAKGRQGDVFVLWFQDDVWRCELESGFIKDDISGFKYPNAKQAIYSCLQCVVEDVSDVMNYYNDLLGSK